ncbi:MAG: YkgJ family cysteine cluster protein [Magnetospirillum sp. WYHS-4]
MTTEHHRTIDTLVGRVIICKGCHTCCENSSAFVLSGEVARMEALGVMLQDFDGVHFIPSAINGRCPMLTGEGRCSIYEDRPIGCRLFPFYLMDRRTHPRQWVVYHFCPKDNQYTVTKGELLLMALEIEKQLSQDEIDGLLHQEAVLARRDDLEVGHRCFLSLPPPRAPSDSVNLSPFSPQYPDQHDEVCFVGPQGVMVDPT